jgi:hypothetical protein
VDNISDTYNQHSSGMTVLVSAKSCTSSTFIPVVSQVFEDGASYRGRLKLLGRTIVKLYYGDLLQADITEGHNSDQAMMIIRDNVTATLQDSSFLLGEPDGNVSFENPFMSRSRRHTN